jgi:hypothetical protein
MSKTSELAETIGRALVSQRQFIPVSDAGLTEASALDFEQYDFVGVRTYWESMIACAVTSLDTEHEERVLHQAREFVEFSCSLRRHVGKPYGAFGCWSSWLMTYYARVQALCLLAKAWIRVAQRLRARLAFGSNPPRGLHTSWVSPRHVSRTKVLQRSSRERPG